MRILFKLLMKFLMMAAMVLLTGSGLRHGTRFITGGGAIPGVEGGVSAEESDLMSTVLQSAMKLLSGKASRSELANDLSEKLYSQRADAGDMSELGIDLVKAKPGGADPVAGLLAGGPKTDASSGQKPGAQPSGSGVSAAAGTAGTAGAKAAAGVKAAPGATAEGQPGGLPAVPEIVSGKSKDALSELWRRIRPYAVELGLVPVVFLGMVLVSRMRRRKRGDDLMPAFTPVLPESDTETYEMKHAVNALSAEDFEMVVAMIYQRQGYRVSLPAALGGGRTGDFRLTRKSERLIVQCKKFNADHRVPVERIRELHEAVAEAGVTGGLYVTTCGFTWDARHHAKTRGIKLITGRTLDALLDAAKEKPDEDLLGIQSWIGKFMMKAELTTPHCPSCEAEMERTQSGTTSVWLCTQRPECRGRRAERKYQKGQRSPAQDAAASAEALADAAPPALSATQGAPAPESAAAPPKRAKAAEAPSPAAAAPKSNGKLLPEPAPATPKSAGRDVAKKGTGVVSKPEVAAKKATAPVAVPKAQPVVAWGVYAAKVAGSGGALAVPPQSRRKSAPEARPESPRAATPPVPGERAGMNVSGTGTPPAGPMQQGNQLPQSQPPSVRGAGAPAGAEDAGTPAAPPARRGFHLPENERLSPKPASGPAGSAKPAGIPPAAAAKRCINLSTPQPPQPKPSQGAAQDPASLVTQDGAGGSAAKPESNVPAPPRRRGFVLPENERMIRKPADKVA